MAKPHVNKLNTLTGHNDCIYTLERSEQNNTFFSGAGDGMVVKWDLNDPENGKLIAKVPHSIYALHYNANHGKLYVGHNYQGVHFVESHSLKEIGSIQINDSSIFDIKSWKDHVITACGNGEVIIFDHQSRAIMMKIQASDKSARCIDINPKRNEAAIGFSDHFIRIYDLENWNLIQEIKAHNNSVFTVKYTPDNRFLLSGSRDAHLKIWDASNYKLSNQVIAHMYAINHIDFSPDTKHFVTCSMDKSIKVWDSENFKLLKIIDQTRHAGHGTSVNKLLWIDQLISCSDDRTISVWDIKFNQ